MPGKSFAPTRFEKAATPKLAGQLNVSSHILGQHLRKQRLTESPGTNPSKFLDEKGGLSKSKGSGLAQHTAPYKHEAAANTTGIGVGGPGFDTLPKP
jgi:hypothetical protein